MSKQPSSHRPRKRFGQNFLTDEGVIGRIAAAINPQEADHIVEIGPGQGALTETLAPTGCRLDVVELDRDLVAGLLAAFSVYSGFKLHSADALKFDFAALTDEGERLRVVGNLPYNISTPLIFKLLENASIIQDMHFMLQLEVVQRLAATPGSKHWGRLGIMAQYHCQVDHLFDVPPESFFPPPKVQSAIVRLTPRSESPWPDCSESELRKVVQAAFAQRRKTLRNNLKGLVSAGQLESLGIDPGARAETLELDQFVDITRGLNA
ncbi:16S rRNA (adenine(1518)-N(6)/adenine(1519)-N(6))-dimethyltransferase [Halioglobus sp. HI00S01]|uniref:16S rRNA (adenine(1518)-N(6)/adenine(1519)-N(6))- dimethyltransferase RsmA n=1 Tax=Halioglobus sp. HI00S01 TaxID=1822214 RepID=UPI0007C218EA|nr:16S rRNA (adenine(1518)-N(6)/adenine(1519)-N(6))-dimethyltransferase RsmA [Halioglobus sp. HI00S01]KZX58385.1 16S rRNA (adenine(1518)-N(6)/adenine(1519)-N(6))-dimethyltransferase [Halioglobus sp. HI00S01]